MDLRSLFSIFFLHTGFLFFLEIAFSSSKAFAQVSPQDIGLRHSRFSFEVGAGVSEPPEVNSFVPGGQGGFSVFYQDKDRLFQNKIFLGAKVRFDLLGGLPALRLRLDADSPALILRAFSEKSLFFYTPVSYRSLLTHLGSSENVGPDGSVVGNSYALFSTRFGYQLIVKPTSQSTTFFSGTLEVGPEGGYLKDQGGQAPLAGFVAAIRGNVESPHVFAKIGVEEHLNLLAFFSSDLFAHNGISALAEIGFPIASVGYPISVARMSVGARTQIDYFDIAMNQDPRRNEPNGLSIFGGAFFRADVGELR